MAADRLKAIGSTFATELTGAKPLLLTRTGKLFTDLAAFAVAAALLLPTTLQAIGRASLEPGWEIALNMATAVLHVVPLVYRYRPLATYAVASLALVVFALAPELPYRGESVPAILFPSTLLYFLALHEVCAVKSRRLADGAALLAVVGAACVIVLVPSDISVGRVALAAMAGCGIAAAWGTGRLRYTRAQYQSGVEEQAALAERARIARELHDVVAHSLTVMVSQAEGGRMATSDAKSRQVFGSISNAGRHALRDMRGLLGVLRSEPAGREPVPGWEAIRTLVEQAAEAGLSVSYTEAGTPPIAQNRPVSPVSPVSPDSPVSPVSPASSAPPADADPLDAGASLAAYRIAQESLTNAMRHAGPGAMVEVVLKWEQQRLRIAVATVGARRRHPVPGGGTRSMRERALAAGGELRSEPAAGGWLVEAWLPLGAGR